MSSYRVLLPCIDHALYVNRASRCKLSGGQMSSSCYRERLHVTHWVGPRADVDAVQMIKSIASTAHEPRPVGRPANS